MNIFDELYQGKVTLEELNTVKHSLESSVFNRQVVLNDLNKEQKREKTLIDEIADCISLYSRVLSKRDLEEEESFEEEKLNSEPTIIPDINRPAEYKYSIDEVLSIYGQGRIVVGNHNINTNSNRYRLFKEKGTICAACGLKAQFFLREHAKDSKSFHFNLYALDSMENKILFTKDHIKPKSKGGTNDMSNLQTMCQHCNQAKADSWNEISGFGS